MDDQRISSSLFFVFFRVLPGLCLLLTVCLMFPAAALPAQPTAGKPGGRVLVAPAPFRKPLPGEPLEVLFMRRLIDEVNPQLRTEDSRCVEGLPSAILREAQAHDLDWRTLFTIAWQESDFDCHAKNRRDRGTAYGPFQIRPLWHPLIGNPRPDYFDPNVAAARVAKVLAYYKKTRSYQNLVNRRFVYPLLCIYQSGENRPVNMNYCRNMGRKRRLLEKKWQDYLTMQQTESKQ